jgi:hypothetical protein
MIKFYPSHINNHQKIDSFLELFNYWKHKKINIKDQDKVFKSSFNEQIINNNSSKEIIISHSGQAKIDNLNSCLDLDDCDFINF